MFKSSKWGHSQDVYETLLRDVRGPNDGKFWRRPWDVGDTCFLNSTQKLTKLTLTDYLSELYCRKIQ